MRNAARWPDNDLVFTTEFGTPLDAANVRRAFWRVAEDAGLQASEWTPRELRHSFVSLLSSAGMPIEDIAHLVGHATAATSDGPPCTFFYSWRARKRRLAGLAQDEARAGELEM